MPGADATATGITSAIAIHGMKLADIGKKASGIPERLRYMSSRRRRKEQRDYTCVPRVLDYIPHRCISYHFGDYMHHRLCSRPYKKRLGYISPSLFFLCRALPHVHRQIGRHVVMRFAAAECIGQILCGLRIAVFVCEGGWRG